NQRRDAWGGPLENRARFALSVYAAIREAVGPGFPVSIKLNSADFQTGGFSEDDSVRVMRWLQDAGIDLVEISGGTYEAPAMTGARSTREREGYFLDFVARARQSLDVPLCITGGFRTREGMEAALAEGAAMVGLARTLCVQPGFPADVLAGRDPESLVRRLSTGSKALDAMVALDVTWYEGQLARMAAGDEPDPELGAWSSLLGTVGRAGLQAFKMRRAR
ncbi:MAG: nitronate monooxygenase, partial [Myxococcales bacterium]|nr:nitronate monooxygenase [Myxococcales bacterium]